MNKKTAKALEQSIRHWERMAAGSQKKMLNYGTGNYEDEEPTEEFCALCRLFTSERGDDDCAECPVFKSSNQTSCEGTPYIEAYKARNIYGIDSPEFKAAATKEVEFLKSLRETE